ncbi:MAG TPA: hypothetical protein VFM18_11660 [Methanosarcina sp.]|nr:hypothetical protein [Methanosarcina sp.]
MKFEEQNKPVGFKPKTFSLTFETAEEYNVFRQFMGEATPYLIGDFMEDATTDQNKHNLMFEIAKGIYNSMDEL